MKPTGDKATEVIKRIINAFLVMFFGVLILVEVLTENSLDEVYGCISED
jgi:hypothetical protein